MCDNASYWLRHANEQLMDENKRRNEEVETAWRVGAREALEEVLLRLHHAGIKGDFSFFHELRDRYSHTSNSVIRKDDIRTAELETAHNKGAREALTRFAQWWSEVETHLAPSNTVAKNAASFRDREYPAPAVADTPKQCKCGHNHNDHYTDGHSPASCVGDQMRCPCRAFEAAVADTGERCRVCRGEDSVAPDLGICSECYRVIHGAVVQVVAMGGGK